jgi:RNA polymerase sigma factor (sigma-70 family)
VSGFPGWATGGRVWHGKAVLLAALMAAQPDSRPGADRRDRNAQLLEEILRRDEHRLRRQARRHAQFPSDADDALQTAYLQFIERYAGVGEPLAWLYTTVKREAWALRKRTSRRRECSLTFCTDAFNGELDLGDAFPTHDSGPAEQVERNELLAERREALAGLKRDERRALWLLGLGLSYAEICEATGWTHTKVNRCVSEGRSALKAGGAL